MKKADIEKFFLGETNHIETGPFVTEGSTGICREKGIISYGIPGDIDCLCGGIFTPKTGDRKQLLLCQVDRAVYRFIDLEWGNRWSDAPINLNDYTFLGWLKYEKL